MEPRSPDWYGVVKNGKSKEETMREIGEMGKCDR